MANPPTIHLSAGQPQAFTVVVTANAVQPDGSNPGTIDTTTPLTLENVQNAAGQAVTPSIDPANNRRIICTPAVLAFGATPLPWSFRVKATGRTTFVHATGDTSAPIDVSGVSWDGNAPGPA
jgi:hypothetical protein